MPAGNWAQARAAEPARRAKFSVNNPSAFPWWAWSSQIRAELASEDGLERLAPAAQVAEDISNTSARHGGRWSDRRCKAWSGCLRNHLPDDCGIPCGALLDSTSLRTTDSASYPDVALVAAVYRTMPVPTASAQSLGRSGSRCLLTKAFKEFLPLLSGQKPEEPRHREQQRPRISVV